MKKIQFLLTILLISAFTSNARIDPIDSMAVRAILDSNFQFNIPVDSVVSVDIKGRVTSLEISDNQIFIIPDAIAALANLTNLVLDDNQITTIPDAIGNLTNLTKLS